MSDDFFPPRIRRAEALPQYKKALRAGGESASLAPPARAGVADFHELREGFIPFSVFAARTPCK